jgi:disease resistance protein RPM1
VIQFERGCMDKLEELSVTFYEDTGRIIVGIEHLKNLKEVQLTGKRNNSFLLIAQEKLRSESNGRPKANQFKVIVRYE